MPSNDPSVRLVLILATFLANDHGNNVTTINQKFETLGVTPITRDDIQQILMNPFVEQYSIVTNYAKRMVAREDDTKGLSDEEILKLLTDVACRCLELGCKVCHPCISWFGRRIKRPSRADFWTRSARIALN
jgi:hypothetical protein